MEEVQIIGGGPAGASAAIAALNRGAAVHVFERCRQPRHKVCGEFIPAEAHAVLERLGLWDEFLRLQPASIRRCRLCFGAASKQWMLPEPAFSVSRLELDRLILTRAVSLGARLTRGCSLPVPLAPPRDPVIFAGGRQARSFGSNRLFGFKAHFRGPVEDAVELHFTRFGYVGFSPIEDKLTNICGIAPEAALRRFGFRIDDLLASDPAVVSRLSAYSRSMPWLNVGPLTFTTARSRTATTDLVYPAGDALAFIDPFTGSGIWNALLTGEQAGMSAAARRTVEEHIDICRKLLDRPIRMSRLFRRFLDAGLAPLAFLVPGAWLYRLTRPSTG